MDDLDLTRGQQKAKILAFLVADGIGHRWTPEYLSNACLAFPVSPEEIESLCLLPGTPLCLLEDGHVEVTEAFDLRWRVHTQTDFRTECHLSAQALSISKPSPPQRIEEIQLAIHVGSPYKPLHSPDVVNLVGAHIENPSTTLQRTEKPQCAPTTVACLAEQCLFPLFNEINVQPKKKSRDPRPVPRFEDFFVDGEVGAGGYGTVYRVRRRTDEQVFAMKCPLENTHDSCVRNEIATLKRLRGKDYIIQFQNEVMGKMSRKPEAGVGEEVNCPSILLEFIDHDKPEVLKKEITIDELKLYSFSLFKALAHLQKERILHLDIKPGNFLFSRKTKRGCLVDFNLARVESERRLNTKRPERGSSRGGTIEAKALERKKCSKRPLVHEDTALTCLRLSKRRREMIERVHEKENLRVNSVTPFPGQSKETSGLAIPKDCPVAASPKFQQQPQSRPNSAKGAITSPLKRAEPLEVNDSLVNVENAGAAQQVEAPGIPQTVLRGPILAGNHRLYKAWKEIDDKIRSCPSTPTVTQSKRVPALKPNPSKRVPAGVPPRPETTLQPCRAKKGKPSMKVKAPVKDGPCVGTKGYRAPEVLMRSPRQTTKVDIWSAGVSLLQLVTGRSPFPSTTTEGALKDIAKMRGSVNVGTLAKSLGQRHRLSKDPYQGTTVKEWSEKHSRRTDLKGRVPSALYDLIEKCLEVNPDSRISAEAALQHEFCLIDVDTLRFSGLPNSS